MAVPIHDSRRAGTLGPRRAVTGGGRSDGRLVGVQSLLDLDPDLGRRVPAAEHDLARRHLMVGVRRIPRGPWAPSLDGADPPLAYLLIEGTLLRAAQIGQRWATELLGPEDVLRPWDDAEGPAGLDRRDSWTALEPVQVAILEWRFATAAARWPQLLSELLARSARRSARLTTLMLVSTIRRLDVRLLVLLRSLADRWGYVATDGIHLPLALTHETLARLAGAQRPSVSTAIGRLVRSGALRREGRGFVLPAELPEMVRRELGAVHGAE
jgi:hypothetical protein